MYRNIELPSCVTGTNIGLYVNYKIDKEIKINKKVVLSCAEFTRSGTSTVDSSVSGKVREVFADQTQPPGACKMALERCQDLLGHPAPESTKPGCDSAVLPAPALYTWQESMRRGWHSLFC